MEIKFRKKDLVKTMRRIDPACKKLVGQLGKWVTQAGKGIRKQNEMSHTQPSNLFSPFHGAPEVVGQEPSQMADLLESCGLYVYSEMSRQRGQI